MGVEYCAFSRLIFDEAKRYSGFIQSCMSALSRRNKRDREGLILTGRGLNSVLSCKREYAAKYNLSLLNQETHRAKLHPAGYPLLEMVLRRYKCRHSQLDRESF